jgi:quercetin dioxygenase-like cupin family protein
MEVKNYQTENQFKVIPTLEKTAELLNREYAQIIHMNLKPGDYIEMHKTPMEVSFYLSHGELDMQIGDEVKKITEGALVESPKNIPHGFRNNYEKNAQILVIKHLTTK